MDSGITSNSANSSSSSALSLAPGLRSQVLQSGLMEAFAAAMATAKDVLARHPPQNQPATQTSVTSSTAAAGAAGAGHSEHVLFQTQHFTHLLHSWHWVCRLWPAGRGEQVAAIAYGNSVAALAAMQLSAAILHAVSGDLPAAVTAAAAAAAEAEAEAAAAEAEAAAAAEAPQSRGSDDHSGRSVGVNSAKSYAGDLYSAVYGVQHTVSWLAHCVFEVLASLDFDMPELRPVLATMVVLLTQAVLAQQWLGPTAAATSTHNTSSRRSSSSKGGGTGSSRPLPSSSSGSSPNTVSTPSEVMNNLLSTKMTHKLEAVLRNLPECTKALSETLGMDSKAVVWAAAAHCALSQHQGESSGPLTVIDTALVVVFEQQSVEDPSQQRLLLLVSATLLHCASNTHIQSLAQAQEWAAIVAGSCTSFITRLCSSFPKQSAQQHGADQREDAAFQGPKPVTPAELKQFLPDIQKVLAMLLQHSQEPQPPSLLSSVGGVEHELPGLLTRLQCHILQSAVGRQEHGNNGTPAAFLQMFHIWRRRPQQQLSPAACWRRD